MSCCFSSSRLKTASRFGWNSFNMISTNFSRMSPYRLSPALTDPANSFHPRYEFLKSHGAQPVPFCLTLNVSDGRAVLISTGKRIPAGSHLAR